MEIAIAVVVLLIYATMACAGILGPQYDDDGQPLMIQGYLGDVGGEISVGAPRRTNARSSGGPLS